MQKMAKRFRELDDTRLIHYEGVFHDRRYNDTSDMESQMYTSVEGIKVFLKENTDRPFIMCEYSHAMGTSLGGLYKYTELSKTEPRYQGGFIWDFRDQALYQTLPTGEKVLGYGGDFGDHPNDNNFSGDGLCYADGNVTPKMQEVKACYKSIGMDFSDEGIRITNRYLFTSTDEFECIASLYQNGSQIKSRKLVTSVPPLSEATITMPFLKQETPGEYIVGLSFSLKEDTLWGKSGHEIAFGQYVYSVAEKTKRNAHQALRVVEGDYNLGVIGEDFRLQFDKARGTLSTYQYKGVELLNRPPKPNFWRAPTDNDRGNLMPMRYGQWKLATLYQDVKEPSEIKSGGQLLPSKLTKTEDSFEIVFQHALPTNPKTNVKMAYRVFGDATIQITLGYKATEGLSPIPAFEIELGMPGEFDQIEWYGLGPEETYVDRRIGGRLGIFKAEVKSKLTSYLVPQECGYLSDVRWAKVVNREGAGLQFWGDKIGFSALPYTSHELENAQHGYELPSSLKTIIRAGEQMGVGGDDSWGALVHPKFLLESNQDRTLVLFMRGVK